MLNTQCFLMFTLPSLNSHSVDLSLDTMFDEYFAPCIKLALMFRPNKPDGDLHDDSASSNQTKQYAYARLDRISAALIDSSRVKELVSFSARGNDLKLSVTKQKTRMAFTVGNIQIDQQSLGMNTKVPVILAPTPVKLPLPTIQCEAWKDNIRSSNINSYEYVTIEVSLMCVFFNMGSLVWIILTR